MKKFSDGAVRLVLKYGLGCVPEATRKELEIALKTGIYSESFIESLFPVVYTYLGRKEKIEEVDVRQYFFSLHNILAKMNGKEECMAKVAKVLKVYANECVVSCEGRIERVKCLEEVEVGDEVVLHAGYVVEKYDKNLHTW